MSLDFGKWSLDNSKLVHFLVAVLVMGGLMSYYLLPKLEDPEIPVAQALVVAVYPGASAHEVELQLADPLEKAIQQTPDVDDVETYCYADMCLINISLLSTVQKEELEQHWDIMRRKIQSAQLPDGVSEVQVMDDFGDIFGMFYAITGDGLSDKELSDYAEYVKRELNLIEGVKRIEIYGQRSECVNVSLRQDKLSHLGVSLVEVIQTLNSQNASVYSGYFDNGDRRVRVMVGDRSSAVEDIENMLIQGHEDDQLRIKDIADVNKEYDEPVRASMTYDKENALGICIASQAGEDVTKLGKAVDARMAELQQTLPAGISFQKVFFQPERVESALNTFLINLLESIVLVIIVLFLFMGWRSSVIVGFSLLIIVMGAFLVLSGLDGTIQRVSLTAFILSMGILVDNAIVIVDGILIDKKRGLPKQEALTNIGKKTAMPLLGATLIAILAFLPIFLSPDDTGIYVRDLFIVMAVALLLSWILALTHVPLMASSMLFGKEEEGASPEESYTSKSYVCLRKVLDSMISHRWVSLTGAVVLVAISAVCFQFLPDSFFPDIEYDQLYMEYKMGEGSNYTRVQSDLDKIQTYLRQRPEVKHITASTGGAPTRYNLVRFIPNPSLAYGELIIDFESPKALVDNLEEIQQEVGEMFPDAYIKFKRYNLMSRAYPIEAQFTGPDPAVLHQLSDSCRAIMERTGAVRLITTNWDPKIPALRVDYNQQNARQLSISRSDIGLSLMAATEGIPVGTYYEGINAQNIYVHCVDKNGEPLSMLEDASVFGMLPNLANITDPDAILQFLSGQKDKSDVLVDLFGTVPLRQVSDSVEVYWEDPIVLRYNGQRQQRVVATPAIGLTAESARQQIDKALQEQLVLPAGYKLAWLGEAADSEDSMKYLFRNYPLAIILMIAILILLFKSYRVPTMLFCCIPLILTGVVPLVYVSGKDFGFVAIIGVLGLVGMVIKNGIVLLDEIFLQQRMGKDPREALIFSTLTRLRPVAMASITTILGMIPLLPDALFGALAVTIIGGLIAGTLTVLLFLPVLYSIFYKIK